MWVGLQMHEFACQLGLATACLWKDGRINPQCRLRCSTFVKDWWLLLPCDRRFVGCSVAVLL